MRASAKKAASGNRERPFGFLAHGDTDMNTSNKTIFRERYRLPLTPTTARRGITGLGVQARL